MLIADIKGKMALHNEVSEDFLTSSVFSTFDFLPNCYLKNFLETAINLNSENLSFPTDPNNFVFWKRFNLSNGIGVEPDLIIFTNNTAFIIESKFFSGKSGEGFFEETDEQTGKAHHVLVDQIAREYILGRYLSKNKIFILNGKKIKISDFFVIYLTKDVICPKKDIEDSIRAINLVEPNEDKNVENKIFWTNWQKINPVLEEIPKIFSSSSIEFKLASQLSAFLERRNLVPFQGYKFLSSFQNLPVKKLPIFYHSVVREYWSSAEFINSIEANDSEVFYNQEKNVYWKNFEYIAHNNENIFYNY